MITSLSKHSILTMDASSLAKLIKNNEVTSVEIVTIYIDQIKNINPIVNAVVESRFTKALKEAKEYDLLAQKKHWIGPLHGVPISIKDAIDVAGMKTTGGLINRKDFIARKDASVVQKLKQGGAIILCKTNTPILSFCQETDNKLYGRTNNPWDITRTPGGSSGGEGALLSVGGAPAGIGSDIGGSIRLPSHFNGIVGFKPGNNQVATSGHYPTTPHPLQQRMLGIGPIGKSVYDMKVLYEIITNQSSNYDSSLTNLSIDLLPDQALEHLTAKSKIMYKQLRGQLHGLSLGKTSPPYFEDSAQLWQEIMSIDGGLSIQREAFPSDRPNVVKEYLIEKVRGNSNYHKYFTWALIGAKLFKPSKQRIHHIEQLINKGDKLLQDYFKNRIMILPVYHTGALKHGAVYSEIFSIKKTYKDFLPYIAYANVWGLPSLTMPITKDENNMPIGIQLISQVGNEGALFKLGKLIEENCGKYERCMTFDQR